MTAAGRVDRDDDVLRKGADMVSATNRGNPEHRKVHSKIGAELENRLVRKLDEFRDESAHGGDVVAVTTDGDRRMTGETDMASVEKGGVIGERETVDLDEKPAQGPERRVVRGEGDDRVEHAIESSALTSRRIPGAK
jgi:uncharacterized protein (UPF0371 family)